MKIDWVTVGPFQENSYLVVDEAAGKAVLVDPGDEAPRIIRMAKNAGVEPEAIWLTHAHLDHVGAVDALRREWSVPVYMHDAELVNLNRVPDAARKYGLTMPRPADPEKKLADGDVMSVGSLRFTVHHTPGHAPGHVVFLGEGVMIGGDLLFAGSIGRTDFPFCDPADMEKSLAHVSTFDRDTVVYPGHGTPTTIGDEVDSNPFLVGVAGRA